MAISCHGSGVLLEDCRLFHNGSALRCTFSSQCLFSHCELKDNGDSPFYIDEDTRIITKNCIGDDVSQEFFLERSSNPEAVGEETTTNLLLHSSEILSEHLPHTQSDSNLISSIKKRRQTFDSVDVYPLSPSSPSSPSLSSDEEYDEMKSSKKRQRKD